MVKINSNNNSDPTSPLTDDSAPGSPTIKPGDDSRALSQRAHQQSDVDGSDRSQHHTIGPSRGQVASGREFAAEKRVRQWEPFFSGIDPDLIFLDTYYQIIRGVCFWWLRLSVGASSAMSGIGSLHIGLPVLSIINGSDWAAGSGFINDNSDVGNRTVVSARFADEQTIVMYYTGGSVTASNPFEWNTGDDIVLQGQYPIARHED